MGKSRIFDGIEYYSMASAATYVGISGAGLRNKIANYNKAHPSDKIQRWALPGARERWIKRPDLDKLLTMQPVEG